MRTHPRSGILARPSDVDAERAVRVARDLADRRGVSRENVVDQAVAHLMRRGRGDVDVLDLMRRVAIAAARLGLIDDRGEVLERDALPANVIPFERGRTVAG